MQTTTDSSSQPASSPVPVVAIPPSRLDLGDLERKVQTIGQNDLMPLAEKYRFRLGRHTSGALGVPTVLMLGNHSSGKSSFINYLFGQDIQKTGVAPTDDGFTLIRHAPSSTDLDGKAVVTHPDLPFRELEQFGQAFVSRLRMKLRPTEMLKDVMLIDSPGMIDAANQKRDRGYDFIGVVRHFAETADLIIFFFDPDKPGTTGESLTAFTESLSGVAHKLLIVMNKVDLFPNIRDFARAYGALCWNLAHVIKTKDLPHIFCTYIDTVEAAKPSDGHLPLADFKNSRDEMIAEIGRAPERRADNLVSGLYDVARRLQAHARVASALGGLYRKGQMQAWTALMVMAAATAGVGWWTQKWALTAGLAAATLVLFGVLKFLAKRRYDDALEDIDRTFWASYVKERAQRVDTSDLLGLWNSVKPELVIQLRRMGPAKIASRWSNSRLFARLDTLIDKDIPDLRRNVLSK